MKKITIGVVVAHLIFLMVLCYTTTPPDLIVPKRFAVKTVSLKAEKVVAAAAAAATVAPEASPVVAKKVAPTKKVEKKVTKAPSPKTDAIAKAKKALANLNKVSSTPTTTIETLSFEGDHYICDLVEKLQEKLKLPEFGEVTVELTLERSGKILNLVIKDAKSLPNKIYVEKTLPSIKFPIFEGSIKHENNHTFIFVLNCALD